LFFFSTLYDLLPPQPPALATRRCLHLSDLETLWVFANSTGHSQEWLCHGTLPRQEIFMRLNHVHLLITPHLPIARIMNGIKGAFARQANAFLGHKGQLFWQDESFDHWVRNSNEFRKIQTYIEYNRSSLASSRNRRTGVGPQLAPRLQARLRKVAQPFRAVVRPPDLISYRKSAAKLR